MEVTKIREFTKLSRKKNGITQRETCCTSDLEWSLFMEVTKIREFTKLSRKKMGSRKGKRVVPVI